MASTSLPIQGGDLPEGLCFTTPAELFAEFLRVMSVNIPSSTAAGFVTGSSTPTAEQRTLPWMRTDGSGRPLGVYKFYSGTWRRFYTDMPGTIKFIDIPLAAFDASGKGTAGGDWDGWAVCNGANTTPDLRNNFIVLGQEYTSGSWKTAVTGSLTAFGGEALHRLKISELPAWVDAAATAGTPNIEYIDVTGTAALRTLNSSATTKLRTQDPVALPPYKVLGAVKFLGYT